MDSDEESLNSEDVMGGLESKVLDRGNKDYEYPRELELVMSTRDNFLTWKDYEY
tara:strand:- start:352 stop:513 length:162 start_codon:yes stop_codon:yes gene_type:complete